MFELPRHLLHCSPSILIRHPPPRRAPTHTPLESSGLVALTRPVNDVRIIRSRPLCSTFHHAWCICSLTDGQTNCTIIDLCVQADILQTFVLHPARLCSNYSELTRDGTAVYLNMSKLADTVVRDSKLPT